MAASSLTFVATLATVSTVSYAFSIGSPSLYSKSLSRSAPHPFCSSSPLSLRRSFALPKMTVESQTTKSTDSKAAELKTNEMNLCDVNSQLCDSDIHTVPLDLDIQTKSQPEKENLMSKVKATGVAGLISYAAWEFLFWTVSAPAAVIMYHQTTGEWPSFSNPESTAKVSAVIFGFLNVARALVPVRIGLTLATVPLVDQYIVKPLNIGGARKEEAKSD